MAKAKAKPALEEIEKLKRLLFDCATRLHMAARLGGNSREAVEGLVGQFLAPIGGKMPAWPTDSPEDGFGFEDDDEDNW